MVVIARTSAAAHQLHQLARGPQIEGRLLALAVRECPAAVVPAVAKSCLAWEPVLATMNVERRDRGSMAGGGAPESERQQDPLEVAR